MRIEMKKKPMTEWQCRLTEAMILINAGMMAMIIVAGTFLWVLVHAQV